MILHMYKIIIGLCPNPDLTWTYSDRNKLVVKPKKSTRVVSTWVKNMRESSFFCEGPILYNLIDDKLREHEYIDYPAKEHVEEFKRKLDIFLRRIPDEPTSPGEARAANSNSLVDQITYIVPGPISYD